MKKILSVIVIMAVIGIAYFFLRKPSMPPAGVLNGPEVPRVTLPEPEQRYAHDFTVATPQGWKQTFDWIPLNSNGKTVQVEQAILESPDFVIGTEQYSEYPVVKSGASISINSQAISASDPDGTLEKSIALMQKYGQISESAPVQYRTVGNVPAATYYWAYEGPSHLITEFDYNGRRYNIALLAVSTGDTDITKHFIPYLPQYKSVLDSFVFEK